jgi:hypothetical protein
MDEDDIENCEEARRELGYYTRKDGDPECQFCLPRYWEPLETLCKWGFDDGNRRRMTGEVEEALQVCGGGSGSLRVGYYVESEMIGMHNHVILRISTGPEEADIIYDWHKGDGAEEDFKGLPVHVRYVMLKYRHDDLLDLATSHEVPAEDLARSKAELDAVEAEMAAADGEEEK